MKQRHSNAKLSIWARLAKLTTTAQPHMRGLRTSSTSRADIPFPFLRASYSTQAPTRICSAHCPRRPRHKVLDVIKAIWVRFNHWENWAARFSPPLQLSSPISDAIQSLIRVSIDWCNLIGMWGEGKNTIDCFCLWHMLLWASDAYLLSSTV